MPHAAIARRALLLLCFVQPAAWAGEPIQVGARLEPLVDDYLIEKLSGDATLAPRRPRRARSSS